MFAICIILFIYLIISFSVKQKWSTVLSYPEDTYKILEDEATRMVKTKNLETEYSCSYNYDNETNLLSFRLFYPLNTNFYITASISNYGLDNPKLDISRSFVGKIDFIFSHLISTFFVLPLVITLLLWGAFFAALLLCRFIAFILYKISERIKV